MSPVPALRGAEAPRNTVILGDCVRVMASLPAGSVDFILTDPPYAARYRSRDGERLIGDDRVDWLEPAYRSMARVLRDDALCLTFYGWHHPDAFTQAWKAAGFTVVGHLVFPKRYASSVRYVAHSHEQAVLLAKGRPPLPRVPANDIGAWHYTGNRRHPTEKSPLILSPY
ncbi:DNA methylase, partial [Jiella endophytica]